MSLPGLNSLIDLSGKRGLVVGIANHDSIAAGCAEAFRQAGARLAITYLNAKALPFVAPVAEGLGSELLLPLDVRNPGELEAVFDQLRAHWGGLDFVLHSIAFAPRDDLHCPLVECSAAGFSQAMDVSCHSFLRMARLALPLMTSGGSLSTVSFYGAERAVPHYNLMGPVKAALEAAVRCLATDLADRHVHVHAISAGPVRTRAASGIDHFDELLDAVQARTPDHKLVTIEDVGRIAAVLASDAGAALTGSTVYVDAGFHVTA